MTDAAFDFDRYDRIRPIRWTGDALELLDQRKLPFEVEYVRCDSSGSVAEAIRALTVRGAPAIGIAAAWGLVLAAADVQAGDGAEAAAKLQPAIDHLNAARPTAVNLAWALARMRRVLAAAGPDWRDALEAEARAIADEDLAANRRMGALGAALIEPGSNVLTHCNTGSLATAGFGTALGVIRAGVAQGRINEVFAGETRPWLQGARLTVWELQQDGIAPTLIADAAASHLMKSGRVQWVVVGADRICANGDVANKIGTYQLAIAARHHGVRFMVAAPSSTVDMDTPSGDLIHIEERDPGELFGVGTVRTAAADIGAWNPVFDVTPHTLIDAIVTERGVIENPDEAAMREAFAS
ncbi:MAG: S-methyl-5-thioribose-1-phosphate isomerase [Lysobacter sp.]|jgi:methylthioribose-1-phosphate isomerase|uniref:Methylthioribose-1-phosphate isomerase n=1 Tax=Novilysobacter luteus TaxID=2822368 RepID=A0ABM8UFQ0_9GAMM|nr:S-methyl-5-thioribose-1-phosphate isomerase [Lysobacter luteus]MDV3254515.1 S-methyl-5-thioribose-1-phosphate isomerase [Lysobacter sp.]MDV5980510.1 S-methyl-5-thioribose-1-phosphate isomerase [Lysobacter sp.]CAG4973664.1 Methylthioribose-1-phosphate isomerase [Lysobacter luteus]